MSTVNFYTNFNDKLDNRNFSTIRLLDDDRWIRGNFYGIELDHKYQFSARLINIDLITDINKIPLEFIEQDTGLYSVRDFKRLLSGFYGDLDNKSFVILDFLKIDMKTVELTFGEAISALKKGFKVTRKGWNGKGMYLWLKPETIVKSEMCSDPELKKICDENGGSILALGTICMYTHDSSGRKAILTGWLASQSDMLSSDWEIIN